MAPIYASVEQLKSSLSESATIVTPDSENYAVSIKRWSAAAEKPAGIVVFPTSAEDVSKAVLYATTNHLELAISGGGHSTSGASSTDGGLCIDLSKMREVIVDPATKTIKAQGGALWADVDAEAHKYGLATVGGTVNHTGIGGLTLGGGYGYLSPRYGLTIDNLLEVEFVLADGSIVTASDKENQDLFWAARGAGNAFGVATSFVYQAHDQKNAIWGGMLIFPPTLIPEVIAFANGLLDGPEGDQLMLVGFGAPPPEFQPVIMAIVFHNGSEEEGKRFYEPLLRLGPLADMTTSMPYPAVNSMLNPAMGAGLRRTMKGSAFLAPLDAEFATGIFKDFQEFITQNPDAIHTVVLWEYVPFGRILEIPQAATAFANRGAYGNLMFGPGWTNPEIDTVCREWTRTMSAKSRAELERRKAEGTDAETENSVGEYANYDGLNVSGTELFGVNFPRLAAMKKIYDPQNVFSKPNFLTKA